MPKPWCYRRGAQCALIVFGDHEAALQRNFPIACDVCSSPDRVTRHHVNPQDRSLRGRPRGATVRLCVECHSIAHLRWGPGHMWSGPTSAEGHIAALSDNLEGWRKARRQRIALRETGTLEPDHIQEFFKDPPPASLGGKLRDALGRESQ